MRRPHRRRHHHRVGDSGLPVRGGIWARYDPVEVAHIDAFRRDPARVWEFYALRLDALARAEPNDGHRALAELEERGWIRAIVTQNVDGLHQRAGSREVVEVHGSLREAECVHCGCASRWPRPSQSCRYRRAPSAGRC